MPIIDMEVQLKEVYFLPNKEAPTTLSAFNMFHCNYETQMKKKITRLRIDNEFMSANIWKNYCGKHGIHLEPIAPHMSQANGIAERGIGITIADTCTLLIDSELLQKYWAEAAAFSVYTQNLIPSHVRPRHIPLEGWMKQKVDVGHLRVFGSKAYVKIPIDKNEQQINGGSKLDNRMMVGKLIGYLPGHGGYQVLLDDRRVVRSKDVEFEEGKPHLMIPNNSGDTDDNYSKRTLATKPPATELTATTSVTLPGTDATEIVVEEMVPLPPPTDHSIPAVSEYWKPVNERQIPKPTEKARQNITVAYASVSLPNTADFADVHHKSNEAVLGMTAESTDLEVPANQREPYQMDKERWVEAEKAELWMLQERETWELVPHLIDRHVIRS